MKEIIDMNNKIDFSRFGTQIDDSYPLVSIVIPCYNDGEYLLEAVESALSQTYPSVEIIIVDDASNDSVTASILKSISHPRITIHHNTENLHLSGTRNRGISLSNGKYILPLDADDKIDASYVQKAVDIMENNSSIGVVYCKAHLFGLQSGIWELPDYSFDHMLVGNVVFATALFLKNDWEKAGGYSENLKAGLEDYDFWLSILELGKEFYQIPEVLFFYRKKDHSMMNDFIDNLSVTKDAYKQIYLNHPGFYEKHKERYLEKLREDQINLHFSYKRMERALAVANDTIKHLEYEKKMLEQSTFWRMTKPARSTIDMLRRVFTRKVSK